ncbi:MAG TPA: PIN domain-containing protein [Casimicrobiaceae bacterium]|nr:PIN domain-containing protein [Casimicrobiaceae bacterium]
MTPRHFFDTNLLVYMISADPEKADRAERLVRAGGHVSVQVLNEFAHVAMRKLHVPPDGIETVMKATVSTCKVHDLTLRDTVNALSLSRHHGFPFYDAVIVASALHAGCTTLWSEDFQHGMKLEGRLTVRNPFRAD